MHIPWALQPYLDILCKIHFATHCGTLCCASFLKIKPEMLGRISCVPPPCCSQGTRKQQFLLLLLELLGCHRSCPVLQ